MITATCHCGNIRIETSRKPSVMRECNCSICRRYGAIWAYYSRKTVKISSKPGTTSAYLWRDRVIEFYHCNVCGCITHYEGADKREGSRVAVNARMLPPEIISDIPIKLFDGADTWKYIEK